MKKGLLITNGFVGEDSFIKLWDSLLTAAEKRGMSLAPMSHDKLLFDAASGAPLWDASGVDFAILWDKDVRLGYQLERIGIRVFNPPRAIEICDDSFQIVRTEMVSLPVIGNVAAGQPILAEENIEEYFPVPADVVPKGESFILKVRGDSMINAGIFSGDRIFVHSCNTANNGDMVVALIDDSATVKTFYKENGHIRLQPENDDMDPIIVDDCQIVGKVFGVYRFYR